jgi:4-amino-4-deoxy-L-arabinose transferase-like glycosyltransferase
MTTGLETHDGFPGYYVAGTLVTCYPWSALLPAAVAAAWSLRRSRPEMGYLLGWIVGPLVMLEAVQTKLIHYYLPAVPACALLVAWLVESVAATEVNLRRWPLGRLSLGLLTGVGIGMAVGLMALALVVPADLRWPSLVLALLLGPATLYALERFQAGATRRAVASLAATWAVALLVIGAWLLPAVDPYRISPRVADRLAALAASEGATPVLASFKAPAVVYELGYPVAELDDRVELNDLMRGDRPLVTALSEPEVVLLSRDPSLDLDVRDTVSGLDVENPLRDKPLRVVVIRRAEGEPPAATTSVSERASVPETSALR